MTPLLQKQQKKGCDFSFEADWACNKCSCVRGGTEVEQNLTELWNRVETMVAGVHSGSVEEMEAFIKEQEK